MSSSLTSHRQSAALVLAYALSGLFPDTLLVDSEVTDVGFCTDIQTAQKLSDEVIPIIEERMRGCIKAGMEISCMDMMRENAMGYFAHLKQPYLIERLQASSDKIVQVYKMGEFVDLCPHPPLTNTGEVGFFKILKIEPATVTLPYSKKQTQVLRFHGTVFSDKAELKAFLKKADTAKKWDHRLLGKEMQLFALSEEACSGCWVWLPKGAILRDILQKWWQNHHPLPDYLPVSTPHYVKSSLLKKVIPRHFDDSSDFFPLFEIEGSECAAAPNVEIMHACAFKMKQHSYRELPVRYVEWTEKLRQVKNIQQWGLFRSRTMAVDTTSIFCTPSQVYDELISSLLFIDKSVKMFGFESRWYLTPRGPKFAGTLKQWSQTQESMVKALSACGLDYSLDKENAGFYGPRIDIRLVDAIGREWNGPSLGVNFNHPERLGIHYQGADDVMHVPIMLTRSMFGSLERFIALLIEHYAGVLPLWLAPEQVRVLPITEKNSVYAGEVYAKCLQAGLRAGFDTRKENLGAKVHAAELEKIPYLLIIGDKEEKQGAITLRTVDQNAKIMELNSFLNALTAEEKVRITEKIK